MNKRFMEHTTSVAFSLTLSKLQCHALLLLEELPLRKITPILEVYNLQGLERRGLVYWRYDGPGGLPNGFQGLTEEGRLVCKLLRAAGITSKDTITPSIAKRMARAENK